MWLSACLASPAAVAYAGLSLDGWYLLPLAVFVLWAWRKKKKADGPTGGIPRRDGWWIDGDPGAGNDASGDGGGE
jgi:hypothetical protein